MLSDPIIKEQNFDLRKYVKAHHFNYSNASTPMIKLTLEFTAEAMATNLTEAPLNKTQRIEKLDNGHYVLTVDIEDSILLDGWINTWKEVLGIIRVEKYAL